MPRESRALRSSGDMGPDHPKNHAYPQPFHRGSPLDLHRSVRKKRGCIGGWLLSRASRQPQCREGRGPQQRGQGTRSGAYQHYSCAPQPQVEEASGADGWSTSARARLACAPAMPGRRRSSAPTRRPQTEGISHNTCLRKKIRYGAGCRLAQSGAKCGVLAPATRFAHDSNKDRTNVTEGVRRLC